MSKKKKPKWKKEYPNLIPINERDEEEALAMRKKGGELQTDKKVIAQHLVALRRGGIDKRSVKRALSILDNPESSDADILALLIKIEKISTTPQELAIVAKNLMDFRKTRHGTADRNNVTNNMQINVQKEGIFTMLLKNLDAEEEKKKEIIEVESDGSN